MAARSGWFLWTNRSHDRAMDALVEKKSWLGPWPLLDSLGQRLAAWKREWQPIMREAEAPEPLVFFHLAKTGGSSIWRMLDGLAKSSRVRPLSVFDIYHHARCQCHDVTRVHEVLVRFKETLRGKRVLIHHHTAHPVGFLFDRRPVYTTVVRDPVDRFISEVNHCRAVLRGEWDAVHQAGIIAPRTEIAGRGWSPRLIEMAVSDGVSFERLVEHAIQEPGLRHYYYQSFHHLLLGEPGLMRLPDVTPDGPSATRLALLVRSQFAYIGRFPRVSEAGAEIARIYKLPQKSAPAPFPHVFQRHSQRLIPHLRPALRAAFQADYAFLSKLGFDFLPETGVPGEDLPC